MTRVSNLVKTIISIIGGGGSAGGALALGLDPHTAYAVGIVALLLVFFGADKAKEFWLIVTSDEDN